MLKFEVASSKRHIRRIRISIKKMALSKINAQAIHWCKNLQVAMDQISGHCDFCSYLWSFAFEMMNLFQCDIQQSSGEMQWVILCNWSTDMHTNTLLHLLKHLFAAFNHFKYLFWSNFSNVCRHSLYCYLRFCVCLEISTFGVSTSTRPIYTLIFHIWDMPLNV